MADGRNTFNMFIFDLEAEWRQEVAEFMADVVLVVIYLSYFLA